MVRVVGGTNPAGLRDRWRSAAEARAGAARAIVLTCDAYFSAAGQTTYTKRILRCKPQSKGDPHPTPTAQTKSSRLRRLSRLPSCSLDPTLPLPNPPVSPAESKMHPHHLPYVPETVTLDSSSSRRMLTLRRRLGSAHVPLSKAKDKKSKLTRFPRCARCRSGPFPPVGLGRRRPSRSRPS